MPKILGVTIENLLKQTYEKKSHSSWVSGSASLHDRAGYREVPRFSGCGFDAKIIERYYDADRRIVDAAGHADVWRQEKGPMMFAPFEANTSYFGRSDQQFMINLRVSDLQRLLIQLREAGVKIDDKTQEGSIGKFAWVYDPEGNKIELWEPSDARQ